MSSYVKPQVLVFQEFKIIPTEITEPLRAHISGPNAVLHRYAVSSEKPQSLLGEYDRLQDVCYAWPHRNPGSLVDDKYTKLYVDDALLLYYDFAASACGCSHIHAVCNKPNHVKAWGLSFKSNGAAYPRSAAFKDRDVKIGDVVKLRFVDPDNACVESNLTTTITGFVSRKTDSLIAPAVSDVNNQGTVAASATVTKVAGPDNCITVEISDNNAYDGAASGRVTEEYVIEAITASAGNCSQANLRVRSASGTDDVAEVLAEFGEDTNIGTRGLKVVFYNNDGAVGCSAAATAAGVSPEEFVPGQTWRVVVTSVFEKVNAISDAVSSDGTDGSGNILAGYTGAKDDTYIIECVRGGTFAGTVKPQITARTVKGLDFSGPTVVSDDGVSTNAVSTAIGTRGVKVKFTGVSGAADAVAGMRKGDKWYITVTASGSGAVNELILRDDLPVAMRDENCHLEMKMFIKDDIEVSASRLGFAPLTNYYAEATQLCVQEGMVAYYPEWTDGGVELPLEVHGGKLYIEYREWLSTLADQVNTLTDVADIDNIPGQLHPDNPLKWGVYKALSNSNGTAVKYTAVTNPGSLDSWVEVLTRIKGRDDMYNLVPLTFDRLVQDLYAAHIGGESNEVANNWKAAFFALQAHPVAKVVGQGVTIGGVLANTVDSLVLATVADDPGATGTQYTRLEVTSGNGYFITNDVRPGDIVRYMYTVDSFGEEQYSEYVVDSVLSESTLLLFSGVDEVVTVPQRVEIYHNRNRNEIVEDVVQQAGSLSNRRVCGVWPDQVGEAGVIQPGFFLAAALGGLASGVVPHQPLTNVEVAGFDDYSRSYQYFNETQLNRLAEAGVWIVTEDKDGTPFTRHALTTDNLDLNRREEMIRRNVDSMSYLFLRRLRPFIGRTNAQEGMVRRLRFEVTTVIDFLTANGYTEELGSQLISGTIRTLQLHPLLKDRIEIVLDLVVPAPLNNIELHLVV